MEINDQMWLKYFPFSKSRDAQSRIINKVLNAFENENKKYAIIEAGTGIGKSAIGLTLAGYLNKNLTVSENAEFSNASYFLTTQKILQDQYEKDFFEKGLESIYSSSNYKCQRKKGNTCADTQTEIKAGDTQNESCKFDCVYKIKKAAFINAEFGITNFSYFLTEINYSKKLPKRKVIIIDEAHNLENELSRFIEISVSTFFAERVLKLNLPNIDDLNTQLRIFNWIETTYFPALKSRKEFMEKQINNMGLGDKLQEHLSLLKQVDMMKSHYGKIEKFLSIYNKENWVCEVESTEKMGYIKFNFKPIDVSQYAQEYLLEYADKIIFMSATIVSLEGYMETLGLNPAEVVCVKEASPFDAKNKPTIFSPAGSMSAGNIDKTLPNLAAYVKKIMEEHKNEKGIIHTHSTKVAEYLKNHVKSGRLLIAHGSDRDAVLKQHMMSEKPTILLSPSMAEGVDLKDDLSRFQIVCKVPFPYLGDKVVKKKMNKWKWWYDTQTIRTVIQSIGRSIRNEKDYAVTYILDADWERVYNKNKDLFSEDFHESYVKL
jgi:ATP-dependent DNA helicase DinG